MVFFPTLAFARTPSASLPASPSTLHFRLEHIKAQDFHSATVGSLVNNSTSPAHNTKPWRRVPLSSLSTSSTSPNFFADDLMLWDVTSVGATFQRFDSPSSLHSRIAATTEILRAVPTDLQAAPIHPHIARGGLAQKNKLSWSPLHPFNTTLLSLIALRPYV